MPNYSWIYESQLNLMRLSWEIRELQLKIYNEKIESYRKAFKEKTIGMEELNSAVQGRELKLSELINIITDEKQ